MERMPAGCRPGFVPYVTWGITLVSMLVLPWIFTGGFAITMLSQMGVLIIFALSYNMLLGQAGMLSFGHAVYSGLGAFLAVHAMNRIGGGTLALPMLLIPLVGGLAGALFGVILGFVATRRSGTPFAMITLGIGELVFASSLMFPGFFGGEGGVVSDRTAGMHPFGLTLGPAIEVYYLIAAWCLLSMIAMHAFSRTPLGRIANAVRDNPERAAFIGYDPRRVRYLVLIASAFFAGIAGGLNAINFEIVSTENLSALRSAGVLLATFIGGVSFFFGPVLGAVVFILFSVALSEYTRAWLFYLGLFFVLMVMYAPGGIASLVAMNLRLIRVGAFGSLARPYLILFAASLPLLGGAIMVIEMGYQLSLAAEAGPMLRLFGAQLDVRAVSSWTTAVLLLAIGALAFHSARRHFLGHWQRAQQAISAGDEQPQGMAFEPPEAR